MALRDHLRSELRAAMRRRDRDAVSALRGALAAIDNAEAVPPGAQAEPHSPSDGAGSTDAPRRRLTEDEVRNIVRREASEHRAGARSVRAHDRARAMVLDAQADLLDTALTA